MPKQRKPTPPAVAEVVDHPAHYGGADNPFEHRKVVAAWDLGYELGCATKYIARAGKKPGVDAKTDLLKAIKYIEFAIERLT
jgi:hypothetical protein